MNGAAFAPWAAFAGSAFVFAGCGDNRGVIPKPNEIHEVHQTEGASSGSSPTNDGDGGLSEVGGTDGYVYVARKPRVTIGLAEARLMTTREGVAYVERLATDFEVCAERLERDGTLAEGAGRFVIVVHEGRPDVGVKLAPGPRVTQNALLCAIAPLRSYLVPGEKDGRGLALEATWQPVH